MFRYGMVMDMPKSFENVEFYGRGPEENYIDRHTSADLGIYDITVTDMPLPLYPSAGDRHTQRPALVCRDQLRRQRP